MIEIVKYTHDHVVHAATDTENRLSRHIREYLDDTHKYYEASVKQQSAVLATEIDRRLKDLEKGVQEQSDANIAAAIGSVAHKLENKVNGALSTMETAIYSNDTAHSSACEERLLSALRKVQDDFESAVDLQSNWIEKRLNAKLDAAKRAAANKAQNGQQTLDIRLGEQEKRISSQIVNLVKDNEDTIQQKLQKKLDNAMKTFRERTQNEFDKKLKQTTIKMTRTQQELHDELKTTMASNNSSLEAKFESRLTATQAATANQIKRLEQEIRDLKQVNEEKNSQLSLKNLLGNHFQPNTSEQQDTTVGGQPMFLTDNHTDLSLVATHSTSEGHAHPITVLKIHTDDQSMASETKPHEETTITSKEFEERSSVLATLAQLNSGIAEILAASKPAHKMAPQFVEMLEKLHLKPASTKHQKQIQRRQTLTAEPANQHNDALVRARAAATKKVKQRALLRERELRTSKTAAHPRIK